MNHSMTKEDAIKWNKDKFGEKEQDKTLEQRVQELEKIVKNLNK